MRCLLVYRSFHSFFRSFCPTHIRSFNSVCLLACFSGFPFLVYLYLFDFLLSCSFLLFCSLILVILFSHPYSHYSSNQVAAHIAAAGSAFPHLLASSSSLLVRPSFKLSLFTDCSYIGFSLSHPSFSVEIKGKKRTQKYKKIQNKKHTLEK